MREDQHAGTAVAIVVMAVLVLLVLVWIFVGPADDWRTILSHDLYMFKQCASASGNCVVPR